MIYLDYNATTPVDEAVLKEMLPYFMNNFGNPSSPHVFGEDALAAVELSRSRIAELLSVSSDNIFFTDSASQANNIILKGYVNNLRPTDRILYVTPRTEHSSVLKTIESIYMANDNVLVKYLDVDSLGFINLHQLEEVISKFDGEIIVSIMTANNEIGTIQDMRGISKLCSSYENVFLHTDAVQALGKVSCCLNDIDAASFSAHKIYGPKGIGAMYIKNPGSMSPLIDGGYQNTFSSGTLNVPGIVGLGKACELIAHDDTEDILYLRDLLYNNLTYALSGITLNGPGLNDRLANNINITIDGVPTAAIVVGLDDIMVSGASACQSGSGRIEPSYVLKEIGCKSPECSVRMSVGRNTTISEINTASYRLIEVINSIRSF